MVRNYKNAVMKELRDQLVRYAPKDKKPAQMDRAEELFCDVRDGVEYSYHYVCLRITEYQSDIFEDVLMEAADVRSDLLSLIEDLSESVDIPGDSVPEKVWTIDELCRRFNVASKTISRWRKTMLCGRKFLFDGKRRIGFLDHSVDWFVRNHQKHVERSSRFSQLSETEKQQFIKKGRELAAMGITPAEVIRRLAQNSQRSLETIRTTLKSFDQKNADISLFARHDEPLRDETKYQIFRSYSHGESVQKLALRYNRTVGSIYRVIGQVRAARIRLLPMTYIDSPEFDMIRSGNEENRVCGPMPVPVAADNVEAKTKRQAARPLEELPPYLAHLYDVPLLTPEQELHLFRKMNYLKCKAVVLRDALNPACPNTQTMRQIEQFYNEAVETKNEIISANLRLVVSIAKRHVGPLTNLFELISDGNLSLIQAVDKFDYTRGNRFSTYATWAIMRNYARSLPVEKRYHERFLPTDSDIFEWTVDERSNVIFEERNHLEREAQVDRFLQELDDREQHIIVNRLGLGREVQPQTLREVGDEMGITKERIRQIEIRALAKLRKAAEGERIDIPGLK